MSRPIREMPDQTAHASPITGPKGLLPCMRDQIRAFVITLAVALVLSLAGAFGTHDLSFLHRLTYWVAMGLCGTFLAVGIAWAIERAGWFNRWPAIEFIVICLSVTPPLSVAIWWLTNLWFGRAHSLYSEISFFFMPTLTVTVVIAGLTYLSERRPIETSGPPKGAPETLANAPLTEGAERFRARLPFKFQSAELYAVSAEDHYLRVHTSAGEHLILMRLGDAVGELAGIAGARTHRSWWVAREAIVGAERQEGKVTLKLKSGLLAPVSRTYVRALRDDGWFHD
ncbi:MAG: LytTR family DNA-binding domain-containing protein [Asticcacaulis sp.]